MHCAVLAVKGSRFAIVGWWYLSWSLLTLYDGGRGAPSGLKLRFNGEVVVQLIIYFVQIRVNAWHANQPNCLTWSDVSTDAEIRCNSKREREQNQEQNQEQEQEREREGERG